jgi:hypothetical protein
MKSRNQHGAWLLSPSELVVSLLRSAPIISLITICKMRGLPTVCTVQDSRRRRLLTSGVGLEELWAVLWIVEYSATSGWQSVSERSTTN